jgi:putative heme-binding domain-containing protein
MFTYDADAEFDMGAPWYRPTRVDHITAGADFGWRGVTGSWPPYFPDHADNAPPALDIGKGSPTAVQFGTGSKFPPRYRRALFILDWAYGRILAIHMTPRGSGYACRAETFLRGRPLNVTDLAFGPDGAMYFITGGRKTQSALYRVEYTGPQVAAAALTPQQEARALHGQQARQARRRLESLFASGVPDNQASIDAAAAQHALDLAWPSLDDPDPRIRYAARIAVEHQPVERWWERALSENRATAAVTALLAAARSGPQGSDRQRIIERLNELPLVDYTTSQKLAALHAYQLCLLEEGIAWSALEPAVREATLRQLHALYPHQTFLVNRAASLLLAALDGRASMAPTMKLLRAAEEPTERLHYLFVLRNVRTGWTPEQRREYFSRLRDAGEIVGGQGMPGFLSRIRDEALATLKETERQSMRKVLDAGLGDEEQLAEFARREPVREWTTEAIARHLDRIGKGRSYERGRRLYREALCSRCHRLGDQGFPVGPDLTAVGSRFSLRDLLQSIVKPSEVIAENYRSARIETKSGKVFTGQVRPGGDYRDPALRLVPDLLRAADVVTIAKSDIESHDWSPLSPMPAGLLNRFELEEILDLLAYVQSGGNPRQANFDARGAERAPAEERP